jgi:hypothetical protein
MSLLRNGVENLEAHMLTSILYLHNSAGKELDAVMPTICTNANCLASHVRGPVYVITTHELLIEYSIIVPETGLRPELH